MCWRERVEETLSIARVKVFRNGGQRTPNQMLTRASSSLPELLMMVGENRMEPRSTRRTLRHSLIVDVGVVDLKSWIQMRECTKDLNLCRCGVSTATPFPAGTKVMLKMVYGREKITAFGKVIYGQ
jgi:CDGSH-type Zn-finger protein